MVNPILVKGFNQIKLPFYCLNPLQGAPSDMNIRDRGSDQTRGVNLGVTGGHMTSQCCPKFTFDPLILEKVNSKQQNFINSSGYDPQ